MNAKTLKKVFTAVLAIAILAVGIPVSMPTVVKADPAVPTFATTANAKDLTSQFYFTDATYQAAYAENGSVTIPSGVGVLNTSGIVNSENAITYAQVKMTFQNASSTVTGDTEIGIAFGYKNWDRTYGGASPIASSAKGDVFYVATRCAHNNQYYITANGEAVGSPKTCYTNSADNEYTITYKYDSNTKILESWFAYPSGVAYNSLDTSTISGFFFDICAIAADGANCDVTFSDFKFWRTYPETAVNYADYTDVVHSEASSVGTAPYNSDSYIAGHSSSVVDYYTFKGLDYDLTDGKEIIMTGDITLPANCSTTTNWGQVGFVMGSANSKPLVSSMVVINNNNKFYNFVHNAYLCDQSILRTAYGDVRIAPRTFNFKVVLTETSINTYINDSLYNNWNGGQAVSLDEAMQAALTSTDLGIYFRNIAPGAEVNNVRIYGSGVAIGDKTYTDFTFAKGGRLNSGVSEYFIQTIDASNKYALINKSLPNVAQTLVPYNVDIKDVDSYSATVKFASNKEAQGYTINNLNSFLGIIVGKYKDASGTEHYLYAIHFADWADSHAMYLWNDNQTSLLTLASSSDLRDLGVTVPHYRFNISYTAEYNDGVYKIYCGDILIKEFNVLEVVAAAEGTDFELATGVIAIKRGNGMADDALVNVTSYSIAAPMEEDIYSTPELPEIKEPIAVGDEFTFDGGKVVVTGVDTDNALLTVKVVADAGYQLVAGSLKNNDANIINAIDEAGTEFTVKLAEEDNVITAAFAAVSSNSVSTSVLGTQLHRTGETIDGIRFLNRIYLGSIATGCNVQTETLTVKYNGSTYTIKDYGMIAAAASDFTDVENLTVDNATWEASGKNGKIYAVTNNYIDVTVIITPATVNAAFLEKEYAVRGYVVLTDGTNDIVIYSNVFVDCCNDAANRGA